MQQWPRYGFPVFHPVERKKVKKKEESRRRESRGEGMEVCRFHQRAKGIAPALFEWERLRPPGKFDRKLAGPARLSRDKEGTREKNAGKVEKEKGRVNE